MGCLVSDADSCHMRVPCVCSVLKRKHVEARTCFQTRTMNEANLLFWEVTQPSWAQGHLRGSCGMPAQACYSRTLALVLQVSCMQTYMRRGERGFALHVSHVFHAVVPI